MTIHTAKTRVCITADKKLCEETDPKSAFLFCPIGAPKTDEELAGFDNAKHFFTGFDAKADKDSVRVEKKHEADDEPEPAKEKLAKVVKGKHGHGH